MKPTDPKVSSQNPHNEEGAPKKNAASDANEGEGSKSADRHYREGVQKTVESGRVEELGEKAKEALDGEEGDELKRAEEEAKRHGDAVPSQDDDARPLPLKRPRQPA